MKPLLRKSGLTLLGIAIAIQLWPVGRTNPPVTADLEAPSDVRAILRRCCYDCHSHETRWPWYSSLPVASWLIAHDVKAGRGQFNFSRWTEYNPFDRASTLVRICEMARARAMPPQRYRMLHAEARLSETDVTELCAWTRLEATRLVGGGS